MGNHAVFLWEGSSFIRLIDLGMSESKSAIVLDLQVRNLERALEPQNVSERE